MKINVLSLFDGISCGRLVLDRLGVSVGYYYSSEIEESSMIISKNNYPNIIQLGDITKITEDVIMQLPKIDIILAGSPCQGFSRQGKMLNFKHKESKLFFEFVRILNFIKDHNNPLVKFFLENVEMKKEWRDIISYYVKTDPKLINSKLSSAQNRSRNYWSNIDLCEIEDRNILLESILDEYNKNNLMYYKGIWIDNSFNNNEVNLIDVVNGEVHIKQATKQGYIVANNGDGINLSFPTSKTRRGRVIKQKSSTLDRSCNSCVFYNNTLRKLQITELEKLQTLPVGYTEGVPLNHRKAAIGNGWNVDTVVDLLKNSSYIKQIQK